MLGKIIKTHLRKFNKEGGVPAVIFENKNHASIFGKLKKKSNDFIKQFQQKFLNSSVEWISEVISRRIQGRNSRKIFQSNLGRNFWRNFKRNF